jgi:RHS repeat-associated protein
MEHVVAVETTGFGGSNADVDENNALAAASTDKLFEANVAYEKIGGDWFRVSTVRTFLKDNDAEATTVQTRKQRLNNFPLNGTQQTVSEIITLDVSGNQTKVTTAIDRAAKKVIVTTDSPASTTDSVSITVNNLLQSATPTTPQSATTYAYDALARLTSVTSPESGTTTRHFNATTGQLASVTDGVQTTSYEYYPAGHQNAGFLKSQTDSQGKKTYFNYSSRGEEIQAWGDASYPVENVYDAYGQRTELHTFRGGSGWQSSTWSAASTGTPDVTKWLYHAPSGLLEKKQDANGKQTVYTHDAAGRPKTRTWARPGQNAGSAVKATYTYEPDTGEVTLIDYSDTTPDVTFEYDRGGRQKTITDAAGTHTRTFTAWGELLTDSVSGGLLNGVKVEAGYDGLLRRASLQVNVGAGVLGGQTYGYDAASRLETVTSGALAATYSYHATRGLHTSTSFTGGTSTSRTYDALGRLDSTTTTPAAAPLSTYTYTYNNLHQRTRVTREDGSYWAYTFNDRGEVASGKRFWSGNTPVSGQQTEYGYDNIGNRNYARSGGDSQGVNLRQSNYAANSLNQYTSRTVPGSVDVLGSADAATIVTVNDAATERRGTYFSKTLDVDNSAGPVNVPVKVVGVRGGAGANGEDAVTEDSGSIFVPPASEPYSYDDDGNLVSDGRWQYAWDAENRLTSMEALPGVAPAAKLRLEFAYDYMGRRIQKKTFGWNAQQSVYQLQSTTKFVYDGWQLVAELDASNALVRHYVWGQDLAGKAEKSSGVGGMLFINTPLTSYLAGYDGNGNLTTLVKSSTGTIAASYEYDTFGNTLEMVGEYAASNPLRFSTKFTDAESGHVYYGYRYYQPQTGRWLIRDPLGETGGLNLNGFVSNNPVNKIDALGLYELDVHYYLTYYLARRHGCFTDAEARNIAEGNQRADEDPDKKPGPGWIQNDYDPIGVIDQSTPDHAQQDRNSNYHALHPGSHQPYLRMHWQNATQGSSGNLFNLGVYLHYRQDMFSHAGYTNPSYGHLYGTHAEDKTDSDVPKAQSMVAETWKTLNEFSKQKRCGCQGKWRDDMWPTINKFLHASGGGTYDRRRHSIEEIDPKYLNRKIAILGVSQR